MAVAPVNFHDDANSEMYALREASLGWRITVTALCDPAGKRVIDVGCGGGIYSRALSEMGAASVVAVDFSAAMLDQAQQTCSLLENVSFVQASAEAIPVPDQSADMILARGLIHHLPELDGFAQELARLLASGGMVLIQDRTPDDISLPAGPENIRGYTFEVFPHLRELDLNRRYTSDQVHDALQQAGLQVCPEATVDEVRIIHDDPESFADSLRRRSGRSILHELDDAQLEHLIAYIRDRLPSTGPVIDKDRWTIWTATKPA